MLPDYDPVEKYLGVPFRHGGRCIVGFDCWGFIKAVYKDLGHDLLDIDDYEPHWERSGCNLFIDNYWKQWKEVEVPRDFDVVLFLGVTGVCSHAGMWYKNKILHSIKGAGVVYVTPDRVGLTYGGSYRLRVIDDTGSL